jgi:hypothetical protein
MQQAGFARAKPTNKATGGFQMMSESMVRGRRNTVLAAVIGSVLAGYAGSAAALQFEFENGTTVNWNTTLSVGANWRAEDPNRNLYSRADGSLIGLYSGTPMIPGQAVPRGDGRAGQQAAGDGNLNWDKGDRFATPFKLISDVEVKKGNFGGLVRVKAWYDQALNDEDVRIGNQANDFNGARPRPIPIAGYAPCSTATPAGTARQPARTCGRRPS